MDDGCYETGDDENGYQIRRWDDSVDSAREDEEREARLREEYEREENDYYDSDGSLEEQYPSRVLVTVGSDMMSQMLENERYCRSVRRWPLVHLDTVIQMSRRVRFMTIETFRSLHRFSIPPPGYREFPNHDSKFEIENLRRIYEYVDTIIILSGLKMVAAGRGVSNAICRETIHNTPDLDFFFHGVSVEEAEAVIRKIVEFWLSLYNMPKVYRNAYCTTLVIPHEYDDEHPNIAYHLHHQIYLDPSGVAGGFDVAANAVIYDGKGIWATEMGAFSIMSGYFIPDMGRRASGFDERVLDCKRDFNPIFFLKDPECANKGKKVKYTEHLGHYEGDTHEVVSLESQTGFKAKQKFTRLYLEATNTVFCADGDFDMMYWGGQKIENAYGDNLNIMMMTNRKLDNLWKSLVAQIGTQNYNEKTLAFWFGADWKRLVMAREDKKRAILEKHRVRLFGIQDAPWGSIGATQWRTMENNDPNLYVTGCIAPLPKVPPYCNRDVIKPVLIGLPFDVCCTLLKGWKSRDCILSTLPRDMFRMLMRILRDESVTSPIAGLMETYGN